jgi:glycerol-3-phosphate cytidylyltransferase-like family protein
MQIEANDGGDAMHAVLSMAYCDYVLLDGKWEDLSDRMRRRFSKMNLRISTARVFSDRRGGIERFIEALEAS